MDSVEEYAKQWTRREKGDLDNLSEWVTSVRFLRQIWIKQNLMGLWALFLHQSLKTQMFAKHLFLLRDKYVVVPANKVHHNIVFVCNSYYADCLTNGIHLATDDTYERGNPGQS
jgi:hypothetical protein